jgi:hypothetical protein
VRAARGYRACDVVCSNDRRVLELAGIVSESHVVHLVISSDYPREPYCLVGSASVVLVELNHLKLRLEQSLQCISQNSSMLKKG